MKKGLFMVILLVVASARGQYVPEFIKEARYHLEDVDSFYLPEVNAYGGNFIDVLNDSVSGIENLMRVELTKHYRSLKNSDTLKESVVLNHLSFIAVKRISGITGAKPEKVLRVKRKLFRIFRSSRSSFGLIEIYAFDLELVQHKKHFYYDKKGENGGFNLYEGKKKPKATEENPEPETTPLHLYTETEMLEQISEKMRKKGLIRELKGGMISYEGFAIIPNRRTFYRKKIPTVKVVVITGTRRLRLLQ